MIPLNIFNSIEYLEPKCPNCRSVVDYGISTIFNERIMSHVCKCGAVLK